MKEQKKNNICLAQALADLRGKPVGDKKYKPVVKSDRGPMDEIRLAEALTDLRGKPEVAKKQEPKVQTGVLKPTQSKGGE
jgi:hypothetical protein